MPNTKTLARVEIVAAVAMMMISGLWMNAVRADDALAIVAQPVEPVVFLDDNDNPVSGILVDLFRSIRDKSGPSASIVIKPTKRGLSDYRSGFDDAVIFLIDNGLEDFSAESIPFLPVNRVYAAKSSVPFSGLADARHLVTAIMLGSSLDALPLEYRPPADHIIWVPSVEQMTQMVERDRFDAILGSDVFIYYHLRKIGKEPEFIHEPILLKKSALAIHLSPRTSKSAAWRKFVAALRDELTTEGYREILRRYLGSFAEVLG